MPRHDPVPLDEVDLSDIDGFADLRGFAQLDTLRAEDPVHWNPEDGGPGFWAVTKYADIWEVDKDPETFTSEKFVNLEDVDDDLMDFRRSILETDGARHLALRKLVQREFTPRNLMKNYEAFLRELTKKTVDEAFAEARDNGGEIDFVKRISADFPLQFQSTGNPIGMENVIKDVEIIKKFEVLKYKAYVGDTEISSLSIVKSAYLDVAHTDSAFKWGHYAGNQIQ